MPFYYIYFNILSIYMINVYIKCFLNYVFGLKCKKLN